MSGLILNGDTSGTVTVTVPAVSGTNTVTIPAATGTLAISGAKFFGYRNAGNVTAATTVLHNVVVTNVGSCYNSGTGIFTVPVAGYYEVMAGGHGENSQPITFSIQQNGTTIAEEYSNGSAYAAMTVFGIFYFAVNDQIKNVVSSGTMWGGNISGLKMSVKFIG